MDNDPFKLVTKRGLAWGVGGLYAVTLSVVAGYSVYMDMIEVATLVLGMLGTTVATIVAFYFGRKTSEE